MKLLWQGWMRAMPALRLLAGAMVLAAIAAHAAVTPWDKPAADLVARIAEVLGPGPVHFMLRNLSAIPNDQLAAIRRILENDLKANGILFADSEGANAVTVTLSENPAGGLWVAEIAEGNEKRIVMVAAESFRSASLVATQRITLHREVIARGSDLEWKDSPAGLHAVSEIVGAAMAGNSLVVLTQETVAVFGKTAQGWEEQARAEFGPLHEAKRDPRGVVIPSADGTRFTAFAPGVTCSGAFAAGISSGPANWTIQCHRSDDPWTLFQTGPDQWARGFYNAGRDYFTGVVVPTMGVELPPFYEVGIMPGWPGGAAVLIGATDGKVELAENGHLEPVAGTRDWGSDFAVISSACGAPAHVIVSSSGDGAGDSLRAYGVSALEAAPASDALMLNGAAMATWTDLDGKSAMMVVRTATQQGRGWEYEVDRVSEACD